MLTSQNSRQVLYIYIYICIHRAGCFMPPGAEVQNYSNYYHSKLQHWQVFKKPFDYSQNNLSR